MSRGAGPLPKAHGLMGEVPGLTLPLDDAPRLMGVPVLMADANAAVERALATPREEVYEGFTLPELSYLSRYGDALGDGGTSLRLALHALLARHAGPARLAVEAGCAVGAHLRVLRAHAPHVVGFDMSAAALRVAHAQLAGAPVPALRRAEGRSFTESSRWVLPATVGVTVPDPLRTLWHLTRMTRPGGLVVVATPFAWRDDITPPHLQLGGGTIPELVERGSERVLADLMTGALPMPPPIPRLAFELLETREVTWRLRDHARCTVEYTVHMVAARRSG